MKPGFPFAFIVHGKRVPGLGDKQSSVSSQTLVLSGLLAKGVAVIARERTCVPREISGIVVSPP
jgi:hypothetical protein